MNTVLVCTNCQGQGLIKLLTQHGALAGYEFVHLKAWLHEAPSAAQLARCKIALYHTAWGKPEFLAQLPTDAQQIALPLLSCAVLWPFTFDKPDEPAGWRFPYGDRNLAAKIKQGMMPEQAVDAYLAEDLAQSVKLDKLMQLEQHKWQHNDSQTQIRLSDFISQHLFRQRLFFTPDHPTDVLLLELANQVLALLQLAPFNRPNWATYNHTLQGIEVPVHPSIVRHFDLPYLAPDHLYPLFGGWLTMGLRDYFIRYAQALQRPGFHDALLEAVAALNQGDFNTAFNISTLIREREPQHRQAIALQAVATGLLGNRNQATALLAQLMQDHGGRP